MSCVPLCANINDYLIDGICTDLSDGLDYDFKWEFLVDKEETLADVEKYKIYKGYSDAVSETNEP